MNMEISDPELHGAVGELRQPQSTWLVASPLPIVEPAILRRLVLALLPDLATEGAKSAVVQVMSKKLRTGSSTGSCPNSWHLANVASFLDHNACFCHGFVKHQS